MTMRTSLAGTITRASAPDHQPLDTLEIALTEDEIASATILQFDPDAAMSVETGTVHRVGEPAMFAVPGHYYSAATWTRLAVGAVGGRPADALSRFLKERARQLG